MNIFGLFEINKIKKIREIHIIKNEKSVNIELLGDGWDWSEKLNTGSDILVKWTYINEFVIECTDPIETTFNILKYFYKDYCEFKLIDKG